MKRAPQYIFTRFGEADVGHSHSSPAAVNRDEDFGQFPYKIGLLFGRKHQVAVALIL